jgi:hypothetical protein
MPIPDDSPEDVECSGGAFEVVLDAELESLLGSLSLASSTEPPALGFRKFILDELSDLEVKSEFREDG